MDVNVEDILHTLTLEEKVSLLAGKDFWETVPILAKGVPAIKVRNLDNLVGLECSDITRFLMDPTVPVGKHSVVVREQHAFLLRAVRPLHGTQSSSNRLAMHLPRRQKPKVLEFCMPESLYV